MSKSSSSRRSVLNSSRAVAFLGLALLPLGVAGAKSLILVGMAADPAQPSARPASPL